MRASTYVGVRESKKSLLVILRQLICRTTMKWKRLEGWSSKLAGPEGSVRGLLTPTTRLKVIRLVMRTAGRHPERFGH